MTTEFHHHEFFRDWRARFVMRWNSWRVELCFDLGNWLFGLSYNGVPRHWLSLHVGPFDATVIWWRAAR
jgi:hypothetical protein